MTKSIFIAILMFVSGAIIAQTKHETTTRPTNSLNINLFGNASLISFNYEKLKPLSENLTIAYMGGLGYTEEFNLFGGAARSYITIPHQISINLGKKRSHLEFGLGGTFFGGQLDHPYIVYPVLGYRIIPMHLNKMNFRIFAQYPLSTYHDDDYIFIPFGFSLGLGY